MARPKDKRPVKQRLKERFTKHLEQCKKTPDECWEWGIIDPNGYGTISAGSSGRGHYIRKYAHRMSYETHKGPIPEGLNVCHHCDNRKCVNPDHLFVGTDLDNHTDKVRKGRQSRGERHGGSKLTEDIVRKIRNGELKPSRKLVRELGIAGSSHLYMIKLGKLWKHVN